MSRPDSVAALTIRTSVRLALLTISVLFLLGLAWVGLAGGVDQLDESRTPGQKAQTVTEFAFGLFALLSVVTAFWAKRWNSLMLGSWIVSVTLGSGLAPVVWGGTSVITGLISAASVLVIALGIAWSLRVGASALRRLPDT